MGMDGSSSGSRVGSNWCDDGSGIGCSKVERVERNVRGTGVGLRGIGLLPCRRLAKSIFSVVLHMHRSFERAVRPRRLQAFHH
uniref:Uncharacterized protein n=1 Tax=Rhizophora mucronata TaxID=61149 RepID=A0A2P2IJ21_RHIMU